MVKLLGDAKEKIMIKVNVSPKGYETILNRNIFYMNEVFISGLKEATSYNNVWTTFLINLNTFYVDNKKRKYLIPIIFEMKREYNRELNKIK